MIRTIYNKELLETLRDRRTLLAMVVVPVVLYPVLIIGGLQLAHVQAGAERAETLTVAVPTEWSAGQLRLVLSRVAAERRRIAGDDDDALKSVPGVIEPMVVSDVRGAVEREEVHAGLLGLPGPTDIASTNTPPVVQVVVNHASDRSREAGARLRQLLVEFREARVRDLLAQTPLGRAGTFDIATENRAAPDAVLRWVLAKIAPVILILMTITGAIYPAIDLTAGERERGTLETLMVCPVPILTLIVGKFLVVTTVALLSAFLNLASIGVTLYFVGVEALIAEPAAAGAGTGFTAASGAALFGVFATILLLMIPFAVLSSAVLLVVCSFARTFKEAQNYVAPVILAALIPCFVGALPGSKLAGPIIVVPVANMVLLTRELLLGHFDFVAVLLVLLSTCLYAAAAVALATRLFGQEAVVFSDAMSLRSVLDRRLLRPRSVPTAAVAFVVVALTFPANFYIQSGLQRNAGESGAVRALVLTGVTLFVLMGLVPFCASLYFKIGLTRTFRMRLPAGRYWLAAILIGLSGWVPAHEILVVQSGVLPMPEVIVQQQEQLTEAIDTMSPVLMLLIFAIIPGICEELFFRGFLLSSLSVSARRVSAVVITAAVFAVFHVMIWRFAVTFVLGLLLGALCWQSRSILPGIVAHVMHNGLAVLTQKFPAIPEAMGIGDIQSATHLPWTYVAGGAVILTLACLLMRERAVPKVPSEPRALASGF
jgi:ABC-2 type transport system permease protein/sodium transport system permease protein